MPLRLPRPRGSGRLLKLFCLTVGCYPTHALADTLFRLTEVVVEQEVRPHPGLHVVRWQGDYYVSDAGVSVTGWGGKASGMPMRFDEPYERTALAGSPYAITFHRRPDGVDVTSVYSTYTLVRHITQTGPTTCVEDVSASLKPGQAFFEVRRLRNHELIFESSRTYQSAQCAFPPMVS